jgi:hypothetical protein
MTPARTVRPLVQRNGDLVLLPVVRPSAGDACRARQRVASLGAFLAALALASLLIWILTVAHGA